MRSTTGNGTSHGPIPVEVLDVNFEPLDDLPRIKPREPFPWIPVALFLVTFLFVTIWGVEFARSFAQNVQPFSGDDSLWTMFKQPLLHPSLLLVGLPFSLALLGILMAHEMGHFLACKYYGIDVSYPFFIPGPPIFGTFGAFLRIRSPLTTRRALFDIGIAGPIAGFLVAVPLAAYAVAASKVVPSASIDPPIVFGIPLVMRGLIGMFHPGADPATILLHPVARAAWVGFLATMLNLIPAWQLDGGHIVYSLTSKKHQEISIGISLGLIALGVWLGVKSNGLWAAGWGFALLVLSLRFKHPPVFDRWEALDSGRKLLALVALGIFVVCFMLIPAVTQP